MREIRPPHPTVGQWARSAIHLPDVVLSTGPAEPYRDNVHETLKLVLVPHGPFELRRRGARHHSPAGSLLALHADDAHSGGPLAGTSSPWSLLCLPPRLLADVGFRALRFPDPVIAGLAPDFRRLHALLEAPVPALEQEAAIARFLAVLAHHGTSVPIASATRVLPGMRDAREYLGDQLHRNVTLAELAAVAGQSPYVLVRAFTHEFGLPPHALHLRLRLDHAKGLLLRGERPALVAQATGFVDQAHFTRRFRRTYGMTPASYQRANAR